MPSGSSESTQERSPKRLRKKATASGLVIPDYEYYDQLQANHKAFVDRYLECGDSILAAERAGYKESANASLKYKANTLRKNLAHIIDERMEDYAKSTDMALLGLNVIKELAHNAESEQVRFNAAKEIVSRVIAPQTQKREVTHNVRVSKLDDNQIESRIAELQKELGMVIDVEPEKTEIVEGT